MAGVGVADPSVRRSARSHIGPWTATFRDGPLAPRRQDRHFAVGPVHEEMVFAPIPGSSVRPETNWQLVGWDSLPVESPWPGQVRYVIADLVADAGDEGQPIAHYTLAGGAGRQRTPEARPRLR